MDGRSKRKKDIPIRYCEVCGKDIPRNTTQYEYRIRPAQYINSRFCSKECRGVYHSNEIRGENNPNWAGGISTANHIARGSNKYKKWRLDVFSRDKYICQKCLTRGSGIQAHHLEGWNNNKKLRYVISNGITLCECCHSEFHKDYGSGNNTLEQFLSFIK